MGDSRSMLLLYVLDRRLVLVGFESLSPLTDCPLELFPEQLPLNSFASHTSDIIIPSIKSVRNIGGSPDPPPVQDARARYTRGAKRDPARTEFGPAGGARPHSSGGQPDRSARRKDDFTIRRWKGAIPAI